MKTGTQIEEEELQDNTVSFSNYFASFLIIYSFLLFFRAKP